MEDRSDATGKLKRMRKVLSGMRGRLKGIQRRKIACNLEFHSPQS